jgi:hypothetical protein
MEQEALGNSGNSLAFVESHRTLLSHFYTINLNCMRILTFPTKLWYTCHFSFTRGYWTAHHLVLIPTTLNYT